MAEKDTSAQRLKLLYLRDIFQKFTSETEALTRNQITDILSDYGITEGRKAFSEDVEALQKYGMDIRMTMGRTASYQLMTRDFELAELKLLADAVSSAKLLSESQSAALLKKLSTLCSDKEAAQIKRTVYVSGRVRQNSNKAVLYNVDTIQRAISSAPKKKISFRYFEYDMRKNKKIPRRSAGVHALRPGVGQRPLLPRGVERPPRDLLKLPRRPHGEGRDNRRTRAPRRPTFRP